MQSSLLNWPDGIERTDPADRESCNRFEAGLRQTRSEIEDEFDRMGVDEWRIEEVSGSSGDPGVVLRWRKDGDEYAAACDRWETKSANMREAYLWVNETRMREKRPVRTAADSFAAARLPSGDGPEAVGVEDHIILGVPPGADDETIREAYRAKAKETHSDAGGNTEQMTRLNKAKERMLGE